MKKKLVSMVLMLSLFLTMLIPTVYGDGVEDYIVIQDGTDEVSFHSSEVRSGNGWSWDGKHTLSLNGFRGAYIGLYVNEAVIDLASGSTNSIILDRSIDPPAYSDYAEYGVLAVEKSDGSSNLTIQGNGSLTVQGGAYVEGDFALKGGTLELEGAEFTHSLSSGEEFSQENHPLWVSGDFNISGGRMSVKAPAPGSLLSGGRSINPAICVMGSCAVTGGEISCVIPETDRTLASYYEGIDIGESYTQTGGTVKIASVYNGDFGTDYGPYFLCSGAATINGGTIKIEGGSFQSDSLNLGDGVTAVGGLQKEANSALVLREGELMCPSESEIFSAYYILISGAGETVPIETPVGETSTTFTDVSPSSYYADAVKWAVEKGITAGTSKTTFSPDDACTRAQVVTFLWRAAGSPAPGNAAMIFTDVPAGSYYEKAVLWAVEKGITKGISETEFGPNVTCSRGQIATFLWRAENAPAGGSINPFTDVAADAYYADAVLWAVEKNVTAGTGSTAFSPDADCTRGQIVTFLYRTYEGK